MAMEWEARLERLSPQRWSIRWQPHAVTKLSVALLDAPGAVLAESDNGELELDVTVRRPVFVLRTPEGKEVYLAERRLPLEGTPNFRDFGGYFTEDGHQVRWGRLYRSGQLADLSVVDQEWLSEIGLAVVCDFRRDEEREREPSRLPDSTQVVGLPITPGSASSFYDVLNQGSYSADQTREFMVEINRDFALEQREPYQRMFQQLLDVDAPLLVHCAAGKDRTGFAVALILACLGVSREQIEADYLLTSEYLCPDKETKRLMRKYGMQGDGNGLRPMLEVRPDYLAAAFSAIDAGFPSLDVYLEQHLGVGRNIRQALRQKLLYP